MRNPKKENNTYLQCIPANNTRHLQLIKDDNSRSDREGGRRPDSIIIYLEFNKRRIIYDGAAERR